MLRAAGLTPDGLSDCWLLLVADEEVTGGTLVGAAALERHLDAGGAVYLLRSVVVDLAVRNGGLGRRLVTRALDVADTVEGGRAGSCYSLGPTARHSSSALWVSDRSHGRSCRPRSASRPSCGEYASRRRVPGSTADRRA